jgi:Bacterial antitoxin of type II TA system, VapB
MSPAAHMALLPHKNLEMMSPALRIKVDVKDSLIRKAMRIGRYPTKLAAIEAELRLLVKTHRQAGIPRLRGKIQWSGSLSESRRS